MDNCIILAIESSCDETAISILKSSGSSMELLCNEVSSQVKLHAKWGGVVPNLAAREHVKNITPLLDLSLKNAGLTSKEIDVIAVTEGPGLIPALMVGVNFAKTLSYLWEKPLIGIHHIEGHIYANFIQIKNQESGIKNQGHDSKFMTHDSQDIKFPALVLVVSGGHTQLVLMKDHLKYEIIGQTLDDAVGEAFDKVARILGIGYPGGPNVAAWAAKYQNPNVKCQIKSKCQNKRNISDQLLVTSDNNLNKNISTSFGIEFPRPMIHKKNFNFSFSGLKTAVLYETKKLKEKLRVTDYELLIPEICHEFQQASIDVLISKTIKAAEQYCPKTIMLAGGVSANKELRKQLGAAIRESLPPTAYHLPPLELTGDNAAMIAAAAAFRWSKMSEMQKKKAMNNWENLQPDANLKLK
ncbi:MAG: putative O-sialoglycoprotein endopeptidase [uncultured bacterium]|nr:MAG: putative O-sialoglycoprotein endopeptidase [uncultured bacterium]KKQ44946.1 MAG: putative tRNA threonylcarbamoyladenosine biosynthesis protein Gcp [Candidatus Moranbacteria bacterium GW2011_GWC2_37_8]KKQ60430.1 MAG: hypothetical protein US82_C0035G0005 [Parcubacteria group bacterium GW2011_GWC1_38_22]KKQ79765.1 MAG: putative tRNA threonylcarbamoyladenosine biosynthesis protein Gcp [Candidatus Moranbacteria bacterium GW2011_GWD2_38_7]